MGVPIEREAPDIDERALVERICAGDERAFERFADCYLPALLRYSRSRLPSDPELARDVAQATICAVIENLAGFRGESALSTWIFACCRHEIAAHFRRAGRRPREVELQADAEWAVGEPGPEANLLLAERADLVHAALDRMPPVQAMAMEWRYVEGLGVEEIARRLESTYKAAESLLSRGRAGFRVAYTRLVGSEARKETEASPASAAAPASSGIGAAEAVMGAQGGLS